MGVDQKKRFYAYSRVSTVRDDAVVLLHDPVAGDVNIKVTDLLAVLARLLPSVPSFTYTDIGGSGKRCMVLMHYVGKTDPDIETGEQKDIWEQEVITV